MTIYRVGDSSPKTINDLMNLMRQSGLQISQPPEHGRFLRFPVTGDRGGEKSGWIKAFYNGDLIYAMYGNWKTGESFTWNSKADLTIQDRIDLDKMKQQAEAEREAMHKEAVATAHELLAQASPAAADADYIRRKRIQPCGALALGSTIVLPLLNIDGDLQSLQYIKKSPRGDGVFTKLFQSGASRKGSFFRINGNDEIYICEGYATGATIHEATGGTVYCALSASNQVDVAEALKGFGKRAVICCDNDRHNPKNPGLDWGRQAAEKTGFPLVYPEFDFDEPEGSDFNDLGVERTGKLLGAVTDDGDSGATEQEANLKEAPAPVSKAIIPYSAFGSPAPLDYLIESVDGTIGILPAMAVGMIFGPSTAGKSFVALDMALCIATGLQWHDHDTRRSRVLFIVGEGLEGFKLRVHAWLHHHGVDPDELEGWFAISTRAFLLDDLHHTAALASAINESRFYPEVVFIDTLATNMKGDENQSGAASLVMRTVEAFRQDPAYKIKHICLIHHTPKGAPNDARGSTVFKANADYQINVYERMGQRVISSAKNKDGMPWTDMYFGLIPVPLNEGINWMGKTVRVMSAVVAIQPQGEAELPEITEEQEQERTRLIGREAAQVAWKNFTRHESREDVWFWHDVKDQVTASYREISQTEDPPSRVREYLTRGKDPLMIDDGPSLDPAQPNERIWRLRHPLGAFNKSE